MDGADSLLAVAIVFLILTWVSTFLRCYVRHWMLRSFAIDDWIAAVTLILFTIFVGFTIEGSRNGLNDHLPPNAPYELGTVQLKWFLLATLVYILTITTLKVSIGYTLLRFAPNKKYRIIIWIVVAVTTVVGIFYFFFLLTECSPPSRFWTAHAEHPKCRDPRITGGAALVLSGVNALTDWIFGLLPIGIVWKLKMSKFQKTVVSGVLAMGIFASIATIVRIESIIVFATAVEDPQPNGIGGILLWSITEPGIGLTAISLAALRPLISRFSVRMRTKFSTSTSASALERSIRVRGLEFELLEEGRDGGRLGAGRGMGEGTVVRVEKGVEEWESGGSSIAGEGNGGRGARSTTELVEVRGKNEGGGSAAPGLRVNVHEAL